MNELEIQILPGRVVLLRRTDADGRRVTFEPSDGQYRPIQIDASVLYTNWGGHDLAAYGEALWRVIFREPDEEAFFQQARGDGPLRIVLDITAMHPELHSHLWEAMHAKDALPVALDPGIEFSRYLSSRAPREYPLAQANTLTIANPSGTAGYEVGGFVDGRQEAEDLDKIADALEPKDALPQGWRVQRTAGLTRDALIATLRGESDPCRVLCLICHGHIVRGDAYLLLDDGRGGVEPVGVEAVAAALAFAGETPGVPSLVILASCQSAGKGGVVKSEHVLNAAATRLVRAGLPCVLAMYGNVDKRATGQFVADFLRHALGPDALVLEAAMQRARAGLGQTWPRPESLNALLPVLFTRLGRGSRLVPPQRVRSATQDERLAEDVQSLADMINDDYVIPIIGPAFAEAILGSQHELALYFARKYAYPTVGDGDLALENVLQFVKMTESANIAHEVEQRIKTVLGRQGERTVEAMQQRAALSGGAIPEYEILARLPFSRYLMVSPDIMLESMVRRTAVANVSSVVHDWRPRASLRAEVDLPVASPEQPLFYYLFSRLDGDPANRKQLVLTEDDCFDYLMGLQSTNRRQHSAVIGELGVKGILMLGLRLEDCHTRILLHMMHRVVQRDNEGGSTTSLYVQLDPENTDEKQRASLSKYVHASMRDKANVEILWCSPREFLDMVMHHNILEGKLRSLGDAAR